jgi:hypothetical protein
MATDSVPALALAVAQGHAIFLDCKADRYFALSPGENDALLALLAGDPISDRATRALASAIGFAADRETLLSLMVPAPLPSLRRLLPQSGAMGWRIRLAAIASLVATTWSLRVRGLRATLEQLVSLPAGAPRRPTIAMGLVVGAHDWMSKHLTAHDACLVRSLALARHLRSRGCEAQLVIGVKADPFAAHCWVQSGDWLLNEELDAVAAFAPILLIR